MAILSIRHRARLPRAISYGAAFCLVLVAQGCGLIEPIFAPADYEVLAEGGTTVAVHLIGGEGVSRLRQRDVINDFMLDLSRESTRESAAFDAMLELESLLESRGFPMAQVDRQFEHSSEGTQVTFSIDQGPLVIVDQLLITGNDSIDDDTLLDYWSRLQSEVLGFGNNLYVASDLEALRNGIASHYRRLGYLDVGVQLGQPEPPLAPSVESVSVTLHVTEGPRYVIEPAKIDPDLAAILPPGSPSPPAGGSPYVAEELQTYALQLAHHLRQHGHADPEIRTTISPDGETLTVAIAIHGDAGPVVRVKRVDIRGHSFAPEHTIRERIDIPVGELFKGDQEEASLFRLYQSGLFRKIDVLHEPAGDGEIIIAFEFEENTRFLIEPLVGYGSYEEIRAGLEFEMLSLLGSDFNFNAKGTTSSKGHRLVASISDTQFMPWLFGYGTTFSVAGDTFRRKEPTFTDTAIGVSPSLSHNFTTMLSGRVAYIFREHRDITSTVIDPGAMFDAYTESSALLEFVYDSRDNPLMPRRGTRLAAQIKHYGDNFGGDVRFDRVRVSASTLLPITDTTRIVLNAETAWLFPEGNNNIIPIQERLFNGGENTVRSFREDKLAPTDLLDINGQVVGGEYRNIFNAELRWSPPLQVTRAVELEIALFGDAGNLGKSASDYGFHDMKYAIGTGLRFLLPIGPVRFDLARNPDPEDRERNWTAHFSIGYPF